MADERRTRGSRTGDSKKEVECRICTNPPYKARRDNMKTTHFPLKHPGKPCKEKGDQTLGSLPKFNFYQPPRQQFVLQIFDNFRFYANLSRICRCCDLHALSRKFLHEKSCSTESFCSLSHWRPLWRVDATVKHPKQHCLPITGTVQLKVRPPQNCLFGILKSFQGEL